MIQCNEYVHFQRGIRVHAFEIRNCVILDHIHSHQSDFGKFTQQFCSLAHFLNRVHGMFTPRCVEHDQRETMFVDRSVEVLLGKIFEKSSLIDMKFGVSCCCDGIL